MHRSAPGTFALIALLLATATPAMAAPDPDTVLDITFPVAAGSYEYSDTYDASRGGGRLHKGTDIMAPRGTPVHAAVGGTVRWITGEDGNPPSYGYMLSVLGDDGLEHGYVHLGTDDGPPSQAYAPGITRGSRVERGQLIGYVGNSGCGCVDHLHYDVEDPRYPSGDDHYDGFRYNPYPSLRAAEDRGDVPGATPPPVSVAGAGQPGWFHPLPPARVLDTRAGLGAAEAPIGHRRTITVDVTGVGGVPEEGVVAVALNVTVTNPTVGGYLTLHPSGETRPGTSTINFTAGQTKANMATVKIGRDGALSVFNFAGDTDAIFDIAGYFTADAADGSAGFVPVHPTRILDTRSTDYGRRGAIGPGESHRVQVAGVGPVPASGVEAVVLNVTATRPTRDGGYLTIHPAGEARPTTSNLNFLADETVPNAVVVKLGTDGAVSLFNYAGSTDVLFDVAGYYTAGQGDTFVPTTPTRVLDTRDGTGAFGGALSRTLTLDLSGLPASDATAVVLNVTVTRPAGPSYLTLYPTGTRRPVASNLNWVEGETVANMVVVRLGEQQRIDVFNYTSSTHVVADVMGYVAP